ncbi:alcohol dehydrogenase catalytic domain-containing protein [Streptomyces sp. NPDC045251]|uniref:alcohol dehydrogenase catalytic domain-containing protein n=1 Tax=unclassified Streptomyces TaxID=2593676 RepID=UPI0033DA5318
MRAVQVVRYGDHPLDNIRMAEVPAPEVSGPHDVIVRIGGAGVCRTDPHILDGQWAQKSGVRLPYTIGHENAGWVHAVGSAVTSVAEGDKVIVHPLMTCGPCRACRAGDDVHCEQSLFPGIDTAGGYAEYLRTTARSVVRLDDSLEPAGVVGAGGLGHIGIQVLKALTAAEVVEVDRNPEALKPAWAIGADHGVVADGDHVEAVRELTDGHGAEVVVDFVGEGGATRDGVGMLRRAGDYHVVGYGENIDVPTIDVISSEINSIGNLVGSYTGLCELMVLAAQDRVRLHTATYPLDRFQDALADLDAGRVRGRAVLVP